MTQLITKITLPSSYRTKIQFVDQDAAAEGKAVKSITYSSDRRRHVDFNVAAREIIPHLMKLFNIQADWAEWLSLPIIELKRDSENRLGAIFYLYRDFKDLKSGVMKIKCPFVEEANGSNDTKGVMPATLREALGKFLDEVQLYTDGKSAQEVLFDEDETDEEEAA